MSLHRYHCLRHRIDPRRLLGTGISQGLAGLSGTLATICFIAVIGIGILMAMIYIGQKFKSDDD